MNKDLQVVEQGTALAPVPDSSGSAFTNIALFEDAQRMAQMLCSSDLVPMQYRGKQNLANAVIAIEIASRTGASVLPVMQNLYVVHGKPGWSAQYIIAAINSTGRFSPLRFEVTGDGDEKTCIAVATDKQTGERMEGPPCSIKMAKDEGWYGKKGSKWQTMPDLMLRYRAATFFGRLYAPEVLMGMRTAEELHDVGETIQTVKEVDESNLNELFTTEKEKTIPPVEENPPTPSKKAKKEVKKANEKAAENNGISNIIEKCPKGFMGPGKSATGCPDWCADSFEDCEQYKRSQGAF